MSHSRHDRGFGFERLEVYQIALGALEKVIALKEQIRGLPGQIAGQLERAAVSTVSNLCEGCGRVSVKDRHYKLSIARGEANEAGGMVELLVRSKAISVEDHAFLRESYISVSRMLSAMMR
jgi:four helix bundle protein